MHAYNSEMLVIQIIDFALCPAFGIALIRAVVTAEWTRLVLDKPIEVLREFLWDLLQG